MSEWRYLSALEVREIHEFAVQLYGGSTGLRDGGLLESALASPRQTMFDEELYPELAAKAAILLVGLVKNHPFVDGNKRTAFLATLRFLEVNGYTLAAAEDELFHLIQDIVSSQIEKEQVTQWFLAHLATGSV
jgi:death-on-curing protein